MELLKNEEKKLIMKKASLFLGGLVLFLGVYIAGSFIERDLQMHPSKDSGLGLRIVALGCLSAIFFSILHRSIKLKIIAMGFFIGITCYIIYFFSYNLFYDPNKGLPDWKRHLSINDDNYIAAALVFLTGIVDWVVLHILKKKIFLKLKGLNNTSD